MITRQSTKNTITGIEYNINNRQISSVYELTLYGRRAIYDSTKSIGNLITAFKHELFERPFDLLCENTPNRVTFLADTYPKQVSPEWIVNKHLITLAGYARIYSIIQAIETGGHIILNYEHRVLDNDGVKGTLEKLYRLENSDAYYGIQSSNITYGYSGYSLSDLTDAELIFYPFIFAPLVEGSTDIFYSTENAFLDRYYTQYSQNGHSPEVPLFIMKKNKFLPNITISKYNVML